MTLFLLPILFRLAEYKKKEFIENWIGNHANSITEEGITLLLEPTLLLNKNEGDEL